MTENMLAPESELGFHVIDKLLCILQTIKDLHNQTLQLQKLCKNDSGETRSKLNSYSISLYQKRI